MTPGPRGRRRGRAGVPASGRRRRRSIVIDPPRTATMPEMVEHKVVLPLPFAPRSTVISPACTTRSMPWSTSTSSYPAWRSRDHQHRLPRCRAVVGDAAVAGPGVHHPFGDQLAALPLGVGDGRRVLLLHDRRDLRHGDVERSGALGPALHATRVVLRRAVGDHAIGVPGELHRAETEQDGRDLRRRRCRSTTGTTRTRCGSRS